MDISRAAPLNEITEISIWLILQMKTRKYLKKYREFWDGIKNEIETINGDKTGAYGKDFMKTKCNTDNNLPLHKPLKLHLLTITVRCIFEEDYKFYPQLYLDACLYELHVQKTLVASKI